MTTIIITENVTMTISEEKANEWYAFKDAEANERRAWNNEELDWEDLEDFEIETWEAWERFCS